MEVPRRYGLVGLAVVALLSVCMCSAAVAESLLPLGAEEASTLAPGKAEVVLGGHYFRNRRFPAFTASGALRSQNLVTVPELGFRVAAGRWAEIQATFEMIYIDETTADGDSHRTYGNGDARLYTKVRALREKGNRPGIGVRFGTKLPNANKSERLGTDETDFEIDSLLSKDFGVVNTHLSLGLLLLGNPGSMRGAQRDGEGQDDLFTYSIAAVTKWLTAETEGAWGLRLLAEISGQAGSRFDNDWAVVRAGLQLRHGGFTVYGGPSVGLTASGEDVGVALGAVYTFDFDRLVGAGD